MHHENDIFKLQNPILKNFFQQLKKKKIVQKIGYACYDIDKIQKYQDIFKFDIIQLPINIFSLNKKKIDFLKKFKKKNNISFHARSIFLQGMALKSISDLDDQFKKLKFKLKILDLECRKNKISRYDYLISCIYYLNFIDYIIIGISSFEDFIKLKKFRPKKIGLSKILSFYLKDKKITDPRLWKI